MPHESPRGILAASPGRASENDSDSSKSSIRMKLDRTLHKRLQGLYTPHRIWMHAKGRYYGETVHRAHSYGLTGSVGHGGVIATAPGLLSRSRFPRGRSEVSCPTCLPHSPVHPPSPLVTRGGRTGCVCDSAWRWSSVGLIGRRQHALRGPQCPVASFPTTACLKTRFENLYHSL
jgi:hypothetical protein